MKEEREVAIGLLARTIDAVSAQKSLSLREKVHGCLLRLLDSQEYDWMGNALRNGAKTIAHLERMCHL